MSNARYDWAAHMPRMIDLYKENLSIPEIHKAIQNESQGFTPKLGIVYSKFRSEGFPTDKEERAKLLRRLNIAKWPSELSLHSSNGKQRQLQVACFTSDNTASWTRSQIVTHSRIASPHLDRLESQKSPFNGVSTKWTAELPLFTTGSVPNADTETQQLHETYLTSLPEEPSSWLATEDEAGLYPEACTSWDFGGTDSLPDPSFDYPAGILKTPSISPSEILKDGSEKLVQSESSSSFETTRAALHTNCKADDLNPLHSVVNGDSAYLPDTPSPSTQSAPSMIANVSQPTGTSFFGGRFIPLRKTKGKTNRSFTPENRNSTATNDSGYASGRNSPFNLLMEGERPNPRSLNEFRGLYRVPCPNLHEPQPYNEDYMPQPTGRFKNTENCPHCQYSGIHNLSWSAKQLKLEVFMTELKLDVFYNVTDLDTAGNSALHYAAVGGANFEHFIALIQAGVNPYQLNTRGQLFLHCLRPQLKNIGSDSFDVHLLTAFNLNLVNLLNRFRLTGAFRWRDNEGMTAVDALALQINDSETTRRIFGAVLNAGHPLEVSIQFKKASKNFKLTNGQLRSISSNPPLTTQEQDTHSKHVFEENEERQNRAWDLLRRASTEPSYVDPETGDNALHALSRVRFPQTRSHMRILSSIRAFVCKEGVDLNLQNREQESPLTAIICHRPFQGIESDETGATMSKYLDALLWKDPLRRIPNKINVNMRNRKGATALYYAAIRGRPDSVRSLIEAGANVNARLNVDGHSISILQATLNAKAEAVHKTDNYALKAYLYDNVISYLEHENAVIDPTISDERRLCTNSVRQMPM